MPFKAFTKKYDNIVSQIILPCGVSEPITEISQETEMTTFNALWDTGATCTVISSKVAKLLELATFSQTTINHANGQSVVNIHDISLTLPNRTLFPFVRVLETELYGFDLLIGMDIISQGDISISNKDGKTTFSFRLPSYREIDFMKEYDEILANK